MKTYVTFGQEHEHLIDGKVLDKDCVAVIETDEQHMGRVRAFDLFGRKFCFTYNEDQWNDEKISWFPRGYVDVN